MWGYLSDGWATTNDTVQAAIAAAGAAWSEGFGISETIQALGDDLAGTLQVAAVEGSDAAEAVVDNAADTATSASRTAAATYVATSLVFVGGLYVLTDPKRLQALSRLLPW